MKGKSDKLTILAIYALSVGFLLAQSIMINYPIDDEASYIIQTKLLLEGKTQPNWLLSTSYLTMLLGMPIIKYAFSFFGLRLLMMVIAATAAPLMYLILREVNAKKDIAVLGAFVLITNPFVALYSREFVTEPISLPLYVLSLLLLIKGIKADDNKLLAIGAIVSFVGFLNRQTNIILALTAILFFIVSWKISAVKSKAQKLFTGLINTLENFTLQILSSGKQIKLRGVERKVIAIIPAIILVILFFAYVFITTGKITNPVTAPATNKGLQLNYKFGVDPIRNMYRLLQDISYIGFMFLPFGIYIKQQLKPITFFGNIASVQKIIIVTSVILAILATLSGKAFIIYGSTTVSFLVGFIFSYSGLNLGVYIIQNRRNSVIINYSFLALIICVLFTFFSIGIFIIRYYIIFLPLILIFLSTKIRASAPYILTIIILGGFGVLMTLNVNEFYETLWGKVDGLLQNGVQPTDIQGQYTVVNWLSVRADNPTGKHVLTWNRHPIFNELVNISSIRVETVK